MTAAFLALFGRLTLLAAAVVLGFLTLLTITLTLWYRHGSHGSSGLGRPPSLARRELDCLVLGEVLAPTAAMGLALAIRQAHPWESSLLSESYVLTVFFGLFCIMATVLGSSVTDWFYILPRRDGVTCPPPCQSSDRLYWQRVTRIWFLHRSAAEVAWVAIPAAGFGVVGFQLAQGGLVSVAKAMASFLVTVVVTMAGFSKENLKSAGHFVRSPPVFALGDSISFRDARAEPKARWMLGFVTGRRLIGFGAVRREGSRLPRLLWLTWDGIQAEIKTRHVRADDDYLLDVALNDCQVLERGKVQGDGMEERIPTASLIHGRANLTAKRRQPCTHAKRCLQLSRRCERGDPRYTKD